MSSGDGWLGGEEGHDHPKSMGACFFDRGVFSWMGACIMTMYGPALELQPHRPQDYNYSFCSVICTHTTFVCMYIQYPRFLPPRIAPHADGLPRHLPDGSARSGSVGGPLFRAVPRGSAVRRGP